MRSVTVASVATLAALFLASPAQAACDARQLQQELAQASPVSLPKLFGALAACDEAAARKAAPNVMQRVLPGEDGTEAAVAALRVGATDAVSGWVGTLQADHRSATLDALGRRCESEPAIADFFAASREREGEQFWKERWYRGLSDCRSEPVQAMLQAAVDDEELARDRALYFAIVEVYARNLGEEAVPRLEAMAGEITDAKEKRLVVSAFADAAQVGNPRGIDTAAAAAAAGALQRLGPSLPELAVEQGRDTLLALDAPDLAGRFVAHRWPDRLGEHGYTYVVAAHELVTCKNGKQQARLHLGDLHEPASRWPDAVQAHLEEAVQQHWSLDAARKCKGTAEVVYEASPEPIADEAARAAWIDEQRKAFAGRTSGFQKVEEVSEDPIKLAP